MRLSVFMMPAGLEQAGNCFASVVDGVVTVLVVVSSKPPIRLAAVQTILKYKSNLPRLHRWHNELLMTINRILTNR